MSADAGTRSFYIEQYSDEVVPCDCTLPGWAAWLSKGGDKDWKAEVPEDGEVFEGSALLWRDDIIATYDGEVWSLSREVDGDFCAVRFGKGWGWSADEIVGATSEEIIDYLTECAATEHVADRVFIAVGVNEDGWRLTYRAGPPASLEVERTQ